jgi:DNA-binding winged helix-turn-helix (wHTH) protein/tetratricopeptide (TPR) repeat protein
MLSPAPKPALDTFTLDGWMVNVLLDEITGNGQTYKLEPRAMRLLSVLAQAKGDVVKSDHLLDVVWPGLIVTPSSLYDAINQLRKVIGAHHIATVPRKGYRLVTPVTTRLQPVDVAKPSLDAIAEAEPRLGQHSVAVLPFDAQGLPDSLSFLRESLTGALISELSRQPGLTVVALGTMLTFGKRHAPPQQVTRELGVRFVVDGTLTIHGDSLHVSVEVADGRHGTQTWADSMQLPTNAWHESANIVVGRLARALRFEVNDLASGAPVLDSDVELQARALAAQAWVQLFARAQTPETNQRAMKLATQARALAPELAQVWMCLAYCDWRAGMYLWSEEPRQSQWSRALAEAERAVALDPRDPDAHYVLSRTCVVHGQRLRAEEALRNCLRLAASYAPAHGVLARLYVRRGLIEEARVHCDRAFALSPLEPLRAIWHAISAEIYLVKGEPQGAFEEAQRAMAINPDYVESYLFGIASAWLLGKSQQAHDWVLELRKHKAYGSLAAVRAVMVPSIDPSQCEELLSLLRKAGLPER